MVPLLITTLMTDLPSLVVTGELNGMASSFVAYTTNELSGNIEMWHTYYSDCIRDWRV